MLDSKINKTMVEESEKSAIREELEEPSPMNKHHPGEESEIPANSDAAAKAMVPPPRHPLEHSWTFWLDKLQSAQRAAWGSSIRPFYTFSTVEDFWSVYNNIRRPSELTLGADFYCFKHKIEPKLEDPICANGGKWTMKFLPGKSNTCWLYTLLAMIGEQFDYGDEVCGAVVHVRHRHEKVSIWTKNAANEALQMSIGRQWKELLDYNESIGFVIHDDAKRMGMHAKNRYNV